MDDSQNIDITFLSLRLFTLKRYVINLFTPFEKGRLSGICKSYFALFPEPSNHRKILDRDNLQEVRFLIQHPDSQHLLLLSLLCLTLYLPALGNRDLWGTVETEYAEVARETLQSHSLEGWLVPHFNGDLYNEKPPLYFWLMAVASLPVGDATEFTTRLPSALTALGTVIALYLLGKHLSSERVGLLASLMLLSSPEFFKSACMVRIDMPVALFFTMSLTGFLLGLKTSKKWFFLLGWFSATLCFLVKGPAYSLLVILILISFLACRKELHRFRETLPLAGAAVFLGIIAIWFIPVYIAAACHLRGLLSLGIWYLRESEYHAEPFYFYLPQFLAGMAPWSIFVVLALFYYYKRNDDLRKAQWDISLLASLWLLLGLVTFSLLTTKHSRYILFIYPAGALLAAHVWEDYLSKGYPLWPLRKYMPVLIVALLAGVTIALFIANKLPYPILTLTLTSTGMLIALYLAYRASQIKLLFGAIFLVLVVSQVVYYWFLLPLQNATYSERPFCQKLLSVMEPGARWAVFKAHRPGFTYYTRSFPKTLRSEEELHTFLSSVDKVYCLLREADYRRLVKVTGRVFKVAELPGLKGKDRPFVLVCNRQ